MINSFFVYPLILIAWYLLIVCFLAKDQLTLSISAAELRIFVPGWRNRWNLHETATWPVRVTYDNAEKLAIVISKCFPFFEDPRMLQLTTFLSEVKWVVDRLGTDEFGCITPRTRREIIAYGRDLLTEPITDLSTFEAHYREFERLIIRSKLEYDDSISS